MNGANPGIANLVQTFGDERERVGFGVGLMRSIPAVPGANPGVGGGVEDGGIEPFAERKSRATSRFPRCVQRFRSKWSRAPRGA